MRGGFFRAVRAGTHGGVRYVLPVLVVVAMAVLPGTVIPEGGLASQARPRSPERVDRHSTEIIDPDVAPPARGNQPKPELVAVTSTTGNSSSPVVGALGASGIPEVALRAYRAAEATMAVNDPGCGLKWSLVAAIGRVESNHGRFAGAQLREDGTSTRPIRGIPLDGRTGVATIRDTDGGRLDGDTTYDRAVGPLQFIPSSWRFAGADGNGDGIKDPDNIFDGALAAAGYLCAGDSDLRDPAQRGRAVFRYNHSSEYVRIVLALADQYEQGPVTALPNVPAAPQPPPPLPSPELPPGSVTPAPSPPSVGLPVTTTTSSTATSSTTAATVPGSSSTTSGPTSTSSTTTVVCPPTTTSTTTTVPPGESTTTTSTTTTTTTTVPGETTSSTTTTTVFDPCAPTYPTTTAAAGDGGAATSPTTAPASATVAPGLGLAAAASAAGSWWVRRRARRSRPRTWPGSTAA